MGNLRDQLMIRQGNAQGSEARGWEEDYTKELDSRGPDNSRPKAGFWMGTSVSNHTRQRVSACGGRNETVLKHGEIRRIVAAVAARPHSNQAVCHYKP